MGNWKHRMGIQSCGVVDPDLCGQSDNVGVDVRIARGMLRTGFGGDFLRFALGDAPTDSVSMRVSEKRNI